MTPDDQTALRSILRAATPFLRIKSATRTDWCRVMEDPNDSRFGPWSFVADFDTLDLSTWRRPGEVLYFVTDAQERLSLVGQSMSRLGGRWKTVPMFDVRSRLPLGRKALFHTSSWPAIEQGLRNADPPSFTVSAIFRADLEPICRSAAGSLRGVLSKPETHLQRMSYHVETWVCALDHGASPLWNKHKLSFARP